MVLIEPVGSPLGYYINMLLGLVLFNSFGTWEEYLVGFIIGRLAGLMIGTGGRYLVGLSVGIPLGSPLESPNPDDEMPDTLLGTPLGSWFGSEVDMCLCSCSQLMDCHGDTCWEVGISCVPPSEALITYKINVVSYFQLM